MKFVPLSFLALSAMLALGCSTESGSEPAPSHGESPDGSSTFECSSDPRVQSYVANLEKNGVLNRARFTLTSADPAPPRRGFNNWTLNIVDSAGNPIPNPTVTISGMMPDHQHGWSTQPTVTAGADGKSFTFEKIYLSMGGVWEVTFDVTSGGSSTLLDKATFTFCIG